MYLIGQFGRISGKVWPSQGKKLSLGVHEHGMSIYLSLLYFPHDVVSISECKFYTQ